MVNATAPPQTRFRRAKQAIGTAGRMAVAPFRKFGAALVDLFYNKDLCPDYIPHDFSSDLRAHDDAKRAAADKEAERNERNEEHSEELYQLKTALYSMHIDPETRRFFEAYMEAHPDEIVKAARKFGSDRS